MDIRLIALDLDRTTLDEKGRLSQANREAIVRAIEQGIHVVVATGRAFSTIPAEVLAIPGIEYAITSNGAAVYHVPDRRMLICYKLSGRAVDRILELTEGAGEYEAFIDGVAYASRRYTEDPEAFGATAQAAEYIKETRHPIDDMVRFIRGHREQLDALDLVLPGEERKAYWWKQLEEQVPGIYITSSIYRLLEVSDRRSGKKSGLAYILERCGVDPAAAAAFGDGENDAEMVGFVGAGVAVANAADSVKKAAAYITAAHDRDGVAEAFEKYLNI